MLNVANCMSPHRIPVAKQDEKQDEKSFSAHFNDSFCPSILYEKPGREWDYGEENQPFFRQSTWIENMSLKTHDVFLSYNSEDHKAVEQIAVYLADKAGLRPWLDKWELVPGAPWTRKLALGLSSAGSCAVFVGESGEGSWQQKEVDAALDLQAKDSEYRVVPILLPG